MGASPKLHTELCEWLRKWDLEDAEDALAQHGCKNMKRLRKMTIEEVEALGLPLLTAKELKERLGDLTRDLRSKDAKIAEDKLAEKIKVQVPAASAPIAGGGSE